MEFLFPLLLILIGIWILGILCLRIVLQLSWHIVVAWPVWLCYIIRLAILFSADELRDEAIE